VKYRPSYPKPIVDALYRAAGLQEGEGTFADVGSGTGIFTRLLLERGSIVYAVEPNREMREAAETLLEGQKGFVSVIGSAEETALEGASVDGVVSAQAFHWFDPVATRAEFARILKPDGIAALIWNRRIVAGDPFAEAYDELLKRYANDYEEVNHIRLGEEHYRAFFRGGEYTLETFDNEQRFDFDGLTGRTASSSYTPLPGQTGYEVFRDGLKRLYEEHAVDGIVTFRYVSELYWGKV
jgi:SAM-dependent methyltransferase